MRACGFLLLVVGMAVILATPGTTQATKSANNNEWVWATGYPKLKSPYGQAILSVTVKYVVTPNAPTWMPSEVEFEVHTWANGDGTGWDDMSFWSFDTNFSSEHDAGGIVVGTGARYFNVKANKCTFRRTSDAALDPVLLENSAFIQFRN